MSTLNQIKSGMSQIWEHLLDGWQQLYRRAANAITRFKAGDEDAEQQQQLALRSTGWGVLAAEVFDDAEKVVVRLEAPGMEGDDFDIEVIENFLVVRGQKKLQREFDEGRYHVRECAFGHFERAIPLPEEVEVDAARAQYKRGVLRVELPKASARRKRKIEVKIS